MRAGLLTSSRNLYAPFGKPQGNRPFSKRKGLFKKRDFLGGAASREGALEGELVGVLETSASRETMGDAGGTNSERGEDFDKIVGGGLALNVGTEGKDDLGGGFQANALNEAGDTKIIGADMV